VAAVEAKAAELEINFALPNSALIRGWICGQTLELNAPIFIGPAGAQEQQELAEAWIPATHLDEVRRLCQNSPAIQILCSRRVYSEQKYGG